MKSILIVEDNEAIIKGLKYLLEQEQFHVIACKNIEETMNIIGKQDIDLAVLDITLPDGSGYEMCEYIKKYTNTPIIFLTARDEEQDVVKGLDMGAEDYIIKPFRNRELLSRINNVLRRFNTESNKITYNNIQINLDEKTVLVDGKDIGLTALEYKILALLFMNIGKTITREQILEKNIVCVLPITENKINGHGFVDGDVITSLSGKTIEVTNTDAEGRLILADALTMAQKLGATRVIDMATLTGACVRALGSTYTGIFSNDDSFYLPFLGASKATKEQIWRLPVDEYFHSELKCSKVADLINSKTLGGNASLAAAFLEEFIEEGTQWIHLDIAGTSDKDEVATGVMIETIVHFLENECK